MGSSDMSVTELAVLGLLAEGSSHGFAISKELAAGSDVGRVFTVRRTLVYRALDRLVEAGLVEPIGTERGEGPRRVVHSVTSLGRLELGRWLNRPVEHVRDLRIEFLLKLSFLSRSGLSPLPLIDSQKRALRATFDALNDEAIDPRDHVDQWRRAHAHAVAGYLDTLAQAYRD